MLLDFDLSYWLGIGIILVSHYAEDVLKLHLQEKTNKPLVVFTTDQLLHSSIILGVVRLYHPILFSIQYLYSTKVLLFMLAILLITQESAVVLRVVLSL